MKGLSIKLVVLVSVVTALIWAFAEAESLRTVEVSADLLFEPETSQDRRVVDIVDPNSPPEAPVALPAPASARVSVQLEGSAEAVDVVARRLRRGALRVRPGVAGLPSESGLYTVRFRDLLAGHPELQTQGVSIRKTEPDSVRVWVDELQTRELRVNVRTPEGVEGLAEARPGVVRVSAPARAMRRLAADAAATAIIDQRAIESLVPGRREAVPNVRVTPPAELAGGGRLVIEPPTVEVLLTASARQSSTKLVSVPVHIRIAPSEMAKFDVQVADSDRALIDVTVSGPVDLIRQIEDKTLPVVAVVPLSFEELERQIASKEAVFSFMPTSLKFEAANRVVRLTITRREPAKPGL